MNTDTKTIQHTPGPWAISGYDSENGTPAYISGKGGEPIASIHRLNPDAEPNARLIAAAPDILQALEGMLNWASRVKQLNPGLEIANALNAVNKAKGQ
jgi:hypothetical protein